MRDLLIRGARVLDPSESKKKQDRIADIWIKDGKIKAIDTPKKIPTPVGGDEIFAKGKWVMPGLIDIHVHLREPGHEYKETLETGLKAAVAGGFTSVACMANTQPVNDNAGVTSLIREKAKEINLCRVFPVGALSKGLRGEELAEIGGMVKAGAYAISDDGMPVMNAYLMRKALDYVKAFHVPIISHAEDAHLVGGGVMNEGPLSAKLGLRGNPAAAEEIMVARDVALCRLTRSPVHFAHISTRVALKHIKQAKEEGLPITAEVTPHHLTLTEECLRTYDTCYKMAPPLRTQEDVEALIEGLSQGVIDIIATDHAPHGLVDKDVEFDRAANGIIGLQTAVPVTLGLVHKKLISPIKWVESFTVRPYRLLGQNHLGTLKVGSDADLTLLDPAQTWTFSDKNLKSKSNNSPYFNQLLKGRVLLTLVKGKKAYEAH